MSDYRVRSGDTLSRIARQNSTTVDALARANNISDPNKIRQGQLLEIPGAQTRPSRARPNPPRGAIDRGGRAAAGRLHPRRGPAHRGRHPGTFTDPANPERTFASRDGVPRFNQGDAAWASRRLGGAGEVGSASRDSIRAKGCAITASAMAISAMSGRTITPGRWTPTSTGAEATAATP